MSDFMSLAVGSAVGAFAFAIVVIRMNLKIRRIEKRRSEEIAEISLRVGAAIQPYREEHTRELATRG